MNQITSIIRPITIKKQYVDMLVYNDSNFQHVFDKQMKYLDSVFLELTCIFPRISKHVRNSHRIVLR